MKYVLAEEGVSWREFWGYIFTPGKPVEITDRGTLEAIKRVPFFKEYQDAVQQKKIEAPAQTPVLEPPLVVKRPRGRPRKDSKWR